MAGSNNLVLDTNIILYAAVNNDEIAMELLDENNIFISDITQIELLGYHRLLDEECKVLKEVIDNLNVVLINESIKLEAINLRRKYALQTPDAIIAATALELDCFLVTADKKLQLVEDIKVIQFEAP